MALEKMPSVLLIGKTWPEHSSTAAGVRTAQLIRIFRRFGAPVTVSSPARPNAFSAELEASGIPTFFLPLNRSEDMRKVLEASEPSICVFDRFTTEEAFSFHLHQMRPQCVRVLDTQDLHFLRAARQRLILQEHATIVDALRHRPCAQDPLALRELSSIFRSDLSLVCSKEELRIIVRDYKVPETLLALGSFFYPPPTASHSSAHEQTGPRAAAEDASAPCSSDERRNFVFIGTFKHAPNVDAVKWLAADIWPRIWAKLPMAECHVYGSYPTREILALHCPTRGFHVLGHAPTLNVLRQYRVGLAPLRFGAGIKGKILDSWRHGTPVVTTPVGAEGLEEDGTPTQLRHMEHETRCLDGPVMDSQDERGGDSLKPGSCFSGGLGTATSAEEFAEDAVELFSDVELWGRCSSQGMRNLCKWFDEDTNGGTLMSAISEAVRYSQERRRKNFVGGMLWQNRNRATEYFSRWVELKERRQDSVS